MTGLASEGPAGRGHARGNGHGGCLLALAELLSDLRTRPRFIDEPPSCDDAGRASTLAQQAGLVLVEGLGVSITRSGEDAAKALDEGDLDGFSMALRAHAPYAAVLDALGARGRLPRSRIPAGAFGAGMRVTPREAVALAWMAVGLGQAYTGPGSFRDGSARPDAPTVARAVTDAFDALAQDGLAKVSDMIPRLCAELRMSPWALARAIPDAVASGALSHLDMSPAAGGPVDSRDRVLAMGERGWELDPVPLDRFHLGQRPIFTIARRATARGG